MAKLRLSRMLRLAGGLLRAGSLMPGKSVTSASFRFMPNCADSTISHLRFHQAFHSSRSHSARLRRTAQPGDGYWRFKNNSQAVPLFQRWAARPTLYYEMGGLGVLTGAFYIYNLEEVPVSGRKRFNVVTPGWEERLGQDQFQQILKQYRGRILSESDRRTLQVRRVLARLLPSSGTLADKEWTVHVIESEETNAFVLPGQHVFVFTSLLPICLNDDGLATVLGHEIGHNVAHHTAESLSRVSILIGLAWLLEASVGLPSGITQMLLNIGFQNPGSRQQESEADYIGLMMMAQSCFEPRAALAFWHRMQEIEKSHSIPPQWMSTHPSSQSREQKLREWLPKALERLEASDCGVTKRYINDFRQSQRG